MQQYRLDGYVDNAETSLLLNIKPYIAHGMRHELSSLARTLVSWVRIPLDAWMSVYIYSIFVLDTGLATG
jgi:hypothetical protein